MTARRRDPHCRLLCWPWITLAITMIAGVVHAVPGAAELCQLDRSLLGQPWRIFTGHLAHWSADHLLWDIVTFIALSAACELIDRRRMIAAIASSAGVISLAMLTLQPLIATYRGMSGIDSALFGLLATMTVIQFPSRATRVAIPLFLSLFILKTSIELMTGGTVFVNHAGGDFVPAPLAHLVGASCGAVIGAFARFAPRGGIATIARA